MPYKVTGEFTWTIEDLGHLIEEPAGTQIKSCPFICGDSKWTLDLYPNGTESVQAGEVFSGLFLTHLESPPGTTTVDTKIAFYVLNAQGVRVNVKLGSKKFDLNSKEDDDHKWGYKEFLSRAVVLTSANLYLIDIGKDNAKIKFGVELTIKKEVQSIPITTSTSISMKTPFLSDYSDFFNNEVVSDVKIVDRNDKSIPAHKVILMRNSTYFAGMFSHHELNENVKGGVFAKNISPEALEEMLKFLYGKKLDLANYSGNPELIFDLLEASDCYGVLALKELCEEFLVKNVSNQNAILSLEFAETFKCNELKKTSLAWIRNNKDIILTTPEWKEFVLRNFDLAHQAVLQICKVKV